MDESCAYIAYLNKAVLKMLPFESRTKAVTVRGEDVGRLECEFGVSGHKLLWINNKVLLYSTGNYIQFPMINHNGNEYKKECMCMCNRITLLFRGI